ncbi:MAG: Peptidase propeptide, partial [Pedosphaera sp.]|nr:Peptidase propeptide [Pedosphaera sp.]
TNFQTVNISIAPPVSSIPNITGLTANPDGSFNLSLTGAPGYTYILQATTNIFSSADWLSVATNTLGTNGVWQFNDAQATNFQQRFYRLQLAQ